MVLIVRHHSLVVVLLLVLLLLLLCVCCCSYYHSYCSYSCSDSTFSSSSSSYSTQTNTEPLTYNIHPTLIIPLSLLPVSSSSPSRFAFPSSNQSTSSLLSSDYHSVPFPKSLFQSSFKPLRLYLKMCSVYFVASTRHRHKTHQLGISQRSET